MICMSHVIMLTNYFFTVFTEAPSISVDPVIINTLNNSTLVLNVSLSMASQLCLQYINANLSWMNNLRSVQSFVNISNSSVFISFNELNLCNYIYYFNVIGIGNVNTEIVSQKIIVLNEGN